MARLALFPLAQLTFIACAHLSHSLPVKISLAFLAATMLCCSLHIVFHEVVHRGWFRRPLSSLAAGAAITILLGSPFEEYRRSHGRHHRYTNALEDATSTWRDGPGGPRPRGFWSYALGWPALIPASVRAVIRERRLGLISRRDYARMKFELALLALLHASLLYFAPSLWMLYFATFYLGWTGVAAVNYMQHPPKHYGTGYTTSNHSAIYNVVFFNNGLHAEHHEQPRLPALELKQFKEAATVVSVARAARNGARPSPESIFAGKGGTE